MLVGFGCCKACGDQLEQDLYCTIRPRASDVYWTSTYGSAPNCSHDRWLFHWDTRLDERLILDGGWGAAGKTKPMSKEAKKQGLT